MITQSALKQQLDYDPDSGYFTWKEIRGKAKTNKPAGTIDPGGYRRIRIFGVQYFAAQLVWIWMTGSPTNKLVDHKNGITDDNRWINREEVVRRYVLRTVNPDGSVIHEYSPRNRKDFESFFGFDPTWPHEECEKGSVIPHYMKHTDHE